MTKMVVVLFQSNILLLIFNPIFREEFIALREELAPRLDKELLNKLVQLHFKESGKHEGFD